LAFKLGSMFKFSLRGDRDSLMRELSSNLRKTALRDAEWSWHLAVDFALVDDRENALMWIENAVERGAYNYPMLAEHDPFLKPLRGESRFRRLLERAKKEWEEFDA
jgi:hypothetical protein